jgi:hypothetical protein
MDKDTFDVINISLKLFEDAKSIEDLKEYALSFDSHLLELENSLDTEAILNELNVISRRILKYGIIYESQSKVLQKLEDTFNFWYNKKLFEVITKHPELKTEKSKEMFVMIDNEEEYAKYLDDINNEKYKLGLLKRVCESLTSYSMKLHSIFKYRVENQKDNQQKR